MTKFFVPATCSGDYFTFFGIVDIHPQLQKWLLKQRKRLLEWHNAEDSLLNVSFWDDDIYWYELGGESLADEDAELLRGLYADPEREHSGPVKLPDDFKMDKSIPARTECDQIIVGVDGVWWKCFPKHTSERVESYRIPWEELFEPKAGTKRAKPRRGK